MRIKVTCNEAEQIRRAIEPSSWFDIEISLTDLTQEQREELASRWERDYVLPVEAVEGTQAEVVAWLQVLADATKEQEEAIARERERADDSLLEFMAHRDIEWYEVVENGVKFKQYRSPFPAFSDKAYASDNVKAKLLEWERDSAEKVKQLNEAHRVAAQPNSN